MELEDEDKDSLIAYESDEQCAFLRPTSAFSRSESDEDNGEAPPISFSVDVAHHTASQDCDENECSKSSQVLKNEISPPNEDRTSEIDEQPPVTWFVTRPTGTQPANALHYHGYDMSAPKSELCWLCLVRRKAFYCKDCVNKGEFTHSDTRRPGNFAEKKDRRDAIQRKTDVVIAVIQSKTAQKSKCQQLEEDIRMCQQRIRYLRHLVEGTRDKKDKTQEAARKHQLMNEKREQRLPLFIDKVGKICRYTSQYSGDLDKMRLNAAQKYNLLEALRKSHVKKLFELVFPVEKVLMSTISSSKISTKSKMSSMTSSDDEMSAAIESLMVDAMSTSYVQGRGWVTLSSPDLQTTNSNLLTSISSSGMKETDQSHENERVVYKIVAPYLSADGDYSTFPAMVIAANDQIQSTIPSMAQDQQPMQPSVEFIASTRAQDLGNDSCMENEISQIHTISAGLTVR